jgi:hypothetical protein
MHEIKVHIDDVVEDQRLFAMSKQYARRLCIGKLGRENGLGSRCASGGIGKARGGWFLPCSRPAHVPTAAVDISVLPL